MLHRRRPFLPNSFVPRFVGRFSFENGRTVLAGTFSMHPFVKLFTAVWLAVVVGTGSLLLVSVLISGLRGGPMPESTVGAIVAPIALAAVGILMVRIGRRLSRGDPEHIAAVIRAALAERA